MRLANAAQPPNALLDPHRVPRQIEVAQRVAELQIAALTAALSADQNA